MRQSRLYVAVKLLYFSPIVDRGPYGEGLTTPRRRAMTKVWTGILIVAAVFGAFLLAAPVIESGTSGSTQYFQAVGTADSGSD
jgi:hypothetical protein